MIRVQRAWMMKVSTIHSSYFAYDLCLSYFKKTSWKVSFIWDTFPFFCIKWIPFVLLLWHYLESWFWNFFLSFLSWIYIQSWWWDDGLKLHCFSFPTFLPSLFLMESKVMVMFMDAEGECVSRTLACVVSVWSEHILSVSYSWATHTVYSFRDQFFFCLDSSRRRTKSLGRQGRWATLTKEKRIRSSALILGLLVCKTRLKECVPDVSRDQSKCCTPSEY